MLRKSFHFVATPSPKPRRTFGRIASVLAPLLLMATPVLAHSPYLKPNQFQPDIKRDHITVEASFSEDDLRPDIAMKADGWHAVAPDGTVIPLTPAASMKDATYLEVPLAQAGTYRISSGERMGRVAKAALQGKNIRFLEGDEKPWPSEQLIDVQSVTRADVYISHGKPSAVPAPANDFGIYPAGNPADAYTGEAVRVRVLEGGKPVVGEAVTIHGDNLLYADKKLKPLELKTDGNGEVTFTPTTAGVYLLQSRVRSASADKAGVWISHTATLTLEVLPQ